ncbi:hypothetical protein [Nostoc sp. C110]|uniref:hypothetical protein n=1 Tax=Nostoc sp. C110 TaxID=3349876 RepID=UPI00370DD266
MPQKKQARPPKWTKRQILDGILYQLNAEIRPESFAIAHSDLVKSFSIVENSQEKKVYGTNVGSRPLGNHNGNG